MVIGIDPGKRGAIAKITESGQIYAKSFHKLTSSEMTRLLKEFLAGPLGPHTICIEAVNAFPGQGVVSVFTFGEGFGFIKGVLYGLGLGRQIFLIRPQVWQAHFGCIRKRPKGLSKQERALYKKTHKEALVRKAKKLYSMATADTADAILIAQYGYDQPLSQFEDKR